MFRFGSVVFACFLFFAAATAFGASPTTGQMQETGQSDTDVEKEAVQLGEVVVTATRSKLPVEEIPADVTVITREQIERSSGLRLDHLLRHYAGIDIRRSSYLSHSADVVLRGMGEMPGRTLIMFDGVPMNKADTGTANWDLLLPQNVERIEIVKGPTSSLYGSNAMGGVINIITREPEDKPVSFEARGMYGSFDTWSTGGTLSGKVDRFGYHVSLDHLESDGYNSVPEEERTEYDVNSTLKEEHFKGKVTYDFPNAAKITLGYLYFDDERGLGERILHEKGAYRKWKTSAPTMDIEWKTGQAKWLLKGFYSKEDYFWNRESMGSKGYTRYEVDVDRVDSGGGLQSTFPVLSWNRVTAGVDFRYGSVDGGDTYIIRNDSPSTDVVHNEGKQRTYSAFINDHMTFGKRLVVDAGFRYDYVTSYDGQYSDSSGFLTSQEYEDESWDNFSPRIAALFKLSDDTSIRGSVGTAFRAPILDDLYREGILRGKIYAANPDLGPEKLLSCEAGLNHNFTKDISLGVTGYYSQGDDFFYPIKIGIDPGTGRDLYQRKNIGKVNIYGVEAKADWKISDMFTLFCNYTYNISKIDEFSEQPSLEGKYLEASPRHKAALGLSFYHPDICRAEVVGRYVGNRYGDTENTPEGELDDYVVCDLKVSRKFTRFCEAYIDILNLFDEKFLYSSDSEGPGIELRGGLTLTF